MAPPTSTELSGYSITEMKTESAFDEIGANVVSEIPATPRAGSSLLARNSFVNLSAQVIPLLLGIATIPFMVSHLGTTRFGLLSLWWVLLGNTSVVDLGLGRATTMFVAEALAEKNRSRLSEVVWTSVILQTILGFSAATLAVAAVPFLLHGVLKIPPSLLHEARASFTIFAAVLAVALPASSLRGVLEATQRFDLVCLVKAPLNSLMFLLPVLVIVTHGGLVGIALLLSVTVGLAGIAYLGLSLYLLPEIRHFSVPSRKVVASLARYGGWVSVSNFVSPILAYADRFFIGSLLSLTSVAYYTAPYDAITRLWILPSSISTALFPAFTTLRGEDAQDKRNAIYVRSIRYLLLCMGPLVLVIIVYAEEILRIWLGTGFAEKSGSVLQLLAYGVLLNSLAWIPFSLLQAQGRPDLTAKFHLMELFLQVGLLWILLITMGITGAALAWTIRVLFDAALLFGACQRLRFVTIENRDILITLGLLSLVGCGIPLVKLGLSRSSIVLVLGTSFVLLGWRFLLHASDRIWIAARLSQFGFSRGE